MLRSFPCFLFFPCVLCVPWFIVFLAEPRNTQNTRAEQKCSANGVNKEGSSSKSAIVAICNTEFF
jgi:hypothetical protein